MDAESGKRDPRSGNYKLDGMFSNPERYAVLNRIIMRDLNNNPRSPTFGKYTKDDIQKYLANPYTYEKQMRNAVNYIYAASPHFRRLIQYFVSLSDLAYVVSPYKVDTQKLNPRTTSINYRRALNMLSSMNIKTQFPKILTVCLREDTFYGTFWVTQDHIAIQQLPSDYCAITTVEGGVPNVSFDFSYFDTYKEYLEFYPEEFARRYEDYRRDTRAMKWQELDAPYSFAVKCNNDILTYSVPPFAGILREIYDIEDYKALKLTKTALENYAILVMTLGVDEDGNWAMDLDKA